MNASKTVEPEEVKRVLDFLRALGAEEQRIAYAVLDGMRLQKALDSQGGSHTPAP